MKRRQRAQRVLLESPLALLRFRKGWARRPLFPLYPGPEYLAILTSACSAPSGDEKKSTAEYAEAAEVFMGKNPKHKSFYGSMLLLASPSSW
jgi:hypothetical protein